MWNVSGKDLKMCEGDYGIELPITVNGTTLTEYDELRLVIKKHINDEAIIIKEFSNIVQNTVNLSLTAAESALLLVGTYVYSLDWYQSGHFMCNLIEEALFKVVEKA